MTYNLRTADGKLLKRADALQIAVIEAGNFNSPVAIYETENENPDVDEKLVFVLNDLESPKTEELNAQIATIELHAGDIAGQLKRIADALELLITVIEPHKDGCATLNIEAVCYTQKI